MVGARGRSLAFALDAAGDSHRPAGPQDLRHLLRAGLPGSGLLVGRRLRELGKPRDWAYEMVFAALIGGLVGSRIDYVIQNWDKVSGDLLGNIFSGSGLVWFGGLRGRRARRDPVGALARLPRLAAVRHGSRAACDRLRDRPHRLPALGRRRLRHPLRPAVGDVLPGRDGPDHGHGSPDARLRDARDGHRRRWCCGAYAIASRPACCSGST